jgi:predicted nucleic acid-binding protein
MSSFCVVLDANVLFPASLRDILLRVADANLYRLNLTEEIVEEVCRNLIKTRRMTEPGAYHLVSAIKRTFPEAFVTGYHSLIPSMTNHTKDRHVLAAAVKAGAQVIVTKNLKDFPHESLLPFDIEVQSPDDFLVHLHYLDSETVAKILIEQAGDLRKPSKTVPELLDMLAIHIPKFVDLVRTQFNSTHHSWSDIQHGE